MRKGVRFLLGIAVFCAPSLSVVPAAHAQEEPGGAKEVVVPKDEPPAEEAAPGDAPRQTTVKPVREGRPCDENFMNSCPKGQECVDARCEAKKRKKREEPVEEEIFEERVRPFRLGLQSNFFFGVGGALSNPRPEYTLALDFGFPTGRSARWHVEVGYEVLNGYNGVKFNPFLLGYTVPLVTDQPVRLEIEIIAAILQSEILFGDGYMIALSSGLRAQLVAVYGIGWAAIAPIGFEIRYAYGIEDIGIRTGAGVNWPFQLIVGIEL